MVDGRPWAAEAHQPPHAVVEFPQADVVLGVVVADCQPVAVRLDVEQDAGRRRCRPRIKATLNGEVALEWTLGSEPGPGRNNAPPHPDFYRRQQPGDAGAGGGQGRSLGEDRQHQLLQGLRCGSEVGFPATSSTRRSCSRRACASCARGGCCRPWRGRRRTFPWPDPSAASCRCAAPRRSGGRRPPTGGRLRPGRSGPCGSCTASKKFAM